MSVFVCCMDREEAKLGTPSREVNLHVARVRKSAVGTGHHFRLTCPTSTCPKNSRLEHYLSCTCLSQSKYVLWEKGKSLPEMDLLCLTVLRPTPSLRQVVKLLIFCLVSPEAIFWLV